MPVELDCFFDKKDLQKLQDSLQTLPLNLRPRYFGEEETTRRNKYQIADKKRFDKFVAGNPAGFFLFADDCLFNFVLHEKGYSKLYCDVKGEESYLEIPLFFAAAAAATPIFGFASEFQEQVADANGSYVITHDDVSSEYEHRNRHYATIGMNNIESWIGRDLDRYVPGVYWYTLLSDELLDKHHVDLAKLTDEAISIETLAGGPLHLLKFYELPGEWKQNAERLDDLCERTEGIFSRRSVELAVSGVDNYLEFSDLVSKWP